MLLRDSVLVIAVEFAVASIGRDAFAQGNVEASRRALIESAQQAGARGDHAQALDLATRAGQLHMSPPLRRLIAQEQAAVGHFADALSSADLCVSESMADPNLPGRDQHVAACRRIADDMHHRVGQVRIVLQSPPASTQVRVAGTDVPAALWGVPYVVTPGSIDVDVTAPGYRAVHQHVSVDSGATVDVNVGALSANEPTPEVATTPAPEHGASPVTASAAPTTTQTAEQPQPTNSANGGGSGLSTQRIVGIVAGVVGLGVLGVGVGFNVAQQSAASNFNGSGCYVNGTVQGPSGCAGFASSASTDETLALVGYIAGGLLVAGGVALFLTGSSSHAESHTTARGWICAPELTMAGVQCAIRY